jgi:hypothetical protein
MGLADPTWQTEMQQHNQRGEDDVVGWRSTRRESSIQFASQPIKGLPLYSITGLFHGTPTFLLYDHRVRGELVQQRHGPT